MALITLKGKEVKTIGELPKIGEKAKGFKLIKTDLEPAHLSDFEGKKIVLNIFPSIDTGTCGQSVRAFNQMASEFENTVVLCISSDLPFAQNRFCAVENLTNVTVLSDYATSQFGKDYGLEIISGPFFSLHSRVVIVIDSEGYIRHTEQVQELVNEPNYEKALEALKKAN